jgi:hypothetical protein
LGRLMSVGELPTSPGVIKWLAILNASGSKTYLSAVYALCCDYQPFGQESIQYQSVDWHVLLICSVGADGETGLNGKIMAQPADWQILTIGCKSRFKRRRAYTDTASKCIWHVLPGTTVYCTSMKSK